MAFARRIGSLKFSGLWCAGKQAVTIVNVRSPSDDRTARARIRDAALSLFAARGVDAVTVRDIAGAAEVSPALVIRHFGSKQGLRDAVDDHVAAVFEAVLAQVSTVDGSAIAVTTMAEAVMTYLPADSAIPSYLGRMLLGQGTAGAALFERLYAVSCAALAEMERVGAMPAGCDPAVRAAVLLLNDLAVLILRDHVSAVVGFDPLSPDGMRRWGAEVLSLYQHGLGGDGTDAQ